MGGELAQVKCPQVIYSWSFSCCSLTRQIPKRITTRMPMTTTTGSTDGSTRTMTFSSKSFSSTTTGANSRQRMRYSTTLGCSNSTKSNRTQYRPPCRRRQSDNCSNAAKQNTMEMITHVYTRFQIQVHFRVKNEKKKSTTSIT